MLRPVTSGGLARAGAVVHRPLGGDDTAVALVLHSRASRTRPPALVELARGLDRWASAHVARQGPARIRGIGA